MVRLTKIYTKTGDKGETSLGNGARVPKHSDRIEATGAVDEANAALGLAHVAAVAAGDKKTADTLAKLQNEIFDLGADLSVPVTGQADRPALRILAEQVEWLERDMDAMNTELAPLNSFILPGGSELAARLHLARTLTRRAERAITRITATGEQVNPALVQYINRLSDHLFVLGRYVNGKGKNDILWVPGGEKASGKKA